MPNVWWSWHLGKFRLRETFGSACWTFTIGGAHTDSSTALRVAWLTFDYLVVPVALAFPFSLWNKFFYARYFYFVFLAFGVLMAFGIMRAADRFTPALRVVAQ